MKICNREIKAIIFLFIPYTSKYFLIDILLPIVPIPIPNNKYTKITECTISVKFNNVIDPDNSFNREFSAFADYESTKLLTEVQSELDAQIVEEIVTDIFQAAASNW